MVKNAIKIKIKSNSKDTYWNNLKILTVNDSYNKTIPLAIETFFLVIVQIAFGNK